MSFSLTPIKCQTHSPISIITPIRFKFYGANIEYDDTETLVVGKIEKLFSSFEEYFEDFIEFGF